MSDPKNKTPTTALTIDQLEAGLRITDEEGTDLHSFWDEHVASFRETVVLAIRETTDALFSPTITLGWRLELEDQLDDLIRYLKLADTYMARREVSCAPSPGPVRLSLCVH
jgi:hypothetical protein